MEPLHRPRTMAGLRRFATASNSNTTSHLVPLFPAASDVALQGFVRVINHSGDAGEVQVEAVDDTGVSYGPLTLSINGDTTVHFNSDDIWRAATQARA